MPERESDQVLVELVQAGDKKAFDLLVSKYHQRVIRLISRLVRNPAEVEDIAQEAFIKAYRSIGQFRGDSAFYTWLYRIAVNSAKNALMASNRRPIPMSDLMKSDENEEGEAWPVESAIDFQTPEALLASLQVCQTVDAAIQSLAEDLRTAIMLREIEGLTYEEIAEAINCPIGTVRSRIFRARETISKQLRPLLDTPENKRW